MPRAATKGDSFCVLLQFFIATVVIGRFGDQRPLGLLVFTASAGWAGSEGRIWGL